MHQDFAEMAARLGLPAEQDVDRLCRRLSEQIGAPVELRRVPPAPGRPCGTSFITWTGTRVIEYTAHLNPLRERHYVLHEFGHFLFGDLDITASHPGLADFTLLDPDAVARTFHRAPAYEATNEQTAEVFATYVDALLHRQGLEPGAAVDETALLADHETMGPIWEMVTAVCPQVVLHPANPAEAELWGDPGFRLARRYTEIIDALDILSRRYSAAVVAATARPGPHKGFAAPSPAAVYAAVIVQAVRDEAEGAPYPQVVMPRHKPQEGPCWQAMLELSRAVEAVAWDAMIDVAREAAVLA